MFGEQFGEQNLSLYRKNNGVHLCQHEVVGEVCINPTDQPFRIVAHPDVHDVGTDVLLADRRKRVAKIILRDCFVHHGPLEDAVEAVGNVRAFDGRGEVEHLSRLRADGNLFVFDFPVLAFGVSRDEKISFEAGVGKFAGAKSEKEQNEKSPLIGFEFGKFEPFKEFLDLVGVRARRLLRSVFLKGISVTGLWEMMPLAIVYLKTELRTMRRPS